MRRPILNAIPFLLLLAGCGGGNGSGTNPIPAGQGRVVFSIKWPARNTPTKVVPVTANSIVVDLNQTDLAKGQPPNEVKSDPIARPSGTAPTITWSKDLPPGKYTITATAYPKSDGTGIAQAVGTGTITIASSQNTSATVIMGSTVTELNILPLNPSVAPGGTTQLSAAATDAAGDIILIANSAVTWTSSDPTIATIDSTGTTPTVHGIKSGTVQISATFTEVEPLLGQNPVVASPITLNIPSTYTYIYTGAAFTSFTNDGGSFQYSSANKITFSVTLSEPLPITGITLFTMVNNLPVADPRVIRWSVSDGTHTANSNNFFLNWPTMQEGSNQSYIRLGANSSGAVSVWLMSLLTLPEGNERVSYQHGVNTNYPDYCDYNLSGSGSFGGTTSNGTWSYH